MSGAITAPAPGSAWPAKVNGRTGQKVLRHSQPYEAGDGFFRPVTKALVTKIMRGVERLAKVTLGQRKKGRRWGDVTPIDLQILEALLFKAMDWGSGKLDWTYEQIREATGRSRQTIAESLDRLEDLGVVERMRRFVRTDVEGKGPQVQQANNAYRVALPPRIAALLGHAARPPLPADFETANLAARMANDVHDAEWTGQANLGSALDKLGRAINQRESRK